MANIFFSRFFSSKNSASCDNAPVSSEYPWLCMNEKYGQGFRLSRHYADEGFGYGSMPDITTHMTIPPSLVEKVLQKHSWIAIVDACIGQYGSAQKILTEEFVDCTGFRIPAGGFPSATLPNGSTTCKAPCCGWLVHCLKTEAVSAQDNRRKAILSTPAPNDLLFHKMAYFSQPLRRKYQNGASALNSISTSANG